jgi:hypothetical protein
MCFTVNCAYQCAKHDTSQIVMAMSQALSANFSDVNHSRSLWALYSLYYGFTAPRSRCHGPKPHLDVWEGQHAPLGGDGLFHDNDMVVTLMQRAGNRQPTPPAGHGSRHSRSNSGVSL